MFEDTDAQYFAAKQETVQLGKGGRIQQSDSYNQEIDTSKVAICETKHSVLTFSARASWVKLTIESNHSIAPLGTKSL